MKPRYLFKPVTRWFCENTDFRNALRAAGLDDMSTLSSRQLGDLVTDHRSSWVRRILAGTGEYYVKTYDYPTWRDRIRGVGRNTWLRTSRVRRESAALQWLRDHGFGGPEVLAVIEERHLGLLSRGVLVTASWPGESLDRLLPRLLESQRTELLKALKSFVVHLHRAGFRDRNLDLRNILARTIKAGGETDEGWQLVKIDSPRHRITGSGRDDDALARADWCRLDSSLAQLGLATQVPGLADR